MRRFLRVVALFLFVTASCGVLSTYPARVAEEATPFAGPLTDACELDPTIVRRISRGSRLGTSEDIVIVPRGFNQLGSFDVVSHSGARNYLQLVPLVLYGPGFIESRGTVARPVTIAGVWPTMGELLGVSLEDRGAPALSDALVPERRGVPKVVVVIVWDGAGLNVLARWPKAWPHLMSLVEGGTAYTRATVGSSPSITPATHANLGTGAWPRDHGVTGIQLRTDEDTIGVTFERRDPASLELSTFGDEIDRALDNEPKVGLLGWRGWHIAMMGRGAAFEGGDRDELALIGFHERITGRRPEFRVPQSLRDFPGLDRHLQRADASDGTRDGRWLGHELAVDQDNPGWVGYQSDALIEMIDSGGYGRDDVPDLLFTNFKATDRVGHLYNMDSREMRIVLRHQDAALGRLVRHLDRQVGDYAIVLTADHGHTPSPRGVGSWPIHQRELEADIDRHFDLEPDRSLTQAMTASGVFVNHAAMASVGIGEEAIASFLRRYTIRENWSGGNLPEGYRGRGGETVFEAAFPAAELDDVAACAGRAGDRA